MIAELTAELLDLRAVALGETGALFAMVQDCCCCCCCCIGWRGD